ncbi:MAG: prepilin-type N-terminal cleavage/methylation domain-containing protein [Gemmatimonadetes bacterium]|nr:prepilin-type N-terminal cleavage/methylation domain-containing protein [Gemmatimonadota bacterium]
MPTRVTDRSGFTLVEVMAALIILVVGVLAIARVTGGLALELRRAGALTSVIAATQTALEAAEAKSYSALLVGSQIDTVRIEGRPYVRTVVVSPTGARAKRIEVTVAPAVPPGPRHALVSYVHKRW